MMSSNGVTRDTNQRGHRKPQGERARDTTLPSNLKLRAYASFSRYVSRVKGRVNSTSVNVLVPDEAKCSDGGSMVHIHSPRFGHDCGYAAWCDSQPQLGLEQQLLTGQTQRNVRA